MMKILISFALYLFLIINTAPILNASILPFIPSNDSQFGYLSPIERINDEDTNLYSLKEFQSFVGLKPTGKFDDQTLRSVKTLRCILEDVSEENASIRNKHYTIHGSNDAVIDPYYKETSEPAADICQDSKIDAVTRTQNGSTYFFKGHYYWELLGENGIVNGYPRRIAEDWGNLQGNLDAALTLSNGQTFFFKGTQYWEFINKRRQPGYPKLINVGFTGIPDNIDAAMVWAKNEGTYFFKGKQYWRYDNNTTPPVHTDFPKPIEYWTGLPNYLDAAFQWKNHISYFFKDDIYYRYDDETEAVKVNYPISTSVWWFGCK